MEIVPKNGINTTDVTLAKNIKIAFAGLRTQSQEVILSSAIENKIIKAIETLVYVQQNGYVQKRKHAMGYQVTTTVDRICCKYSFILSTHSLSCGQHCDFTLLNNKGKVLGFEGRTVCLVTVMNQSYTVLEDEKMDELFLHAPEIINTVRNNGCVTDDLLDTFEIVKLHINRDDMVTWREHSHVLSHSDSKAKFTNYLRMWTERDDPAL